MKKLKLILTYTVAIAFTLVIFFGCGKSDKSVKVGDDKTTGEKKKAEKILNVNVSESIVNWLGKKVTGQHEGTIGISKGTVELDKDNKVTGGSFDIDMKAIKDNDLTDAENNAKLIGHLSSDDFFAISKFPVTKFEIVSVSPLNDAKQPNFNSNVSGKLTIKDVTKAISFPADIKFENGVLTAKADFDIDRTEFGLKYGSGKFFENLGDKMINDNFGIKFNLTAK